MAKTIKPVAHKRVINQAKKIVGQSEYKSEKAEQLLKDISPFMTKKGELRKNISAKNLQKFNSIITTYQKGGTPSLTSIKKKSKKALKTARQNQTYETREEQKDYEKLFSHPAVRDLITKEGFTSGQVEAIYHSFKKVSMETLIKAFSVIRARLINDVPDEVLDQLPYDDAFRNIEEFLQMTPDEQERMMLMTGQEDEEEDDE